jgi:hypothetical protein
MRRPQTELLIYYISDGGASVIVGDRSVATPKDGGGRGDGLPEEF